MTSFPISGSYVVRGRISDKDGDFTDYTTIVEVSGANRSPIPNAGGAYSVLEGGLLALDASASTDPNPGDILSFTWDINGDGVFGDAVGVMPLLTWAELQTLGIDDGVASGSQWQVTVRVSDGVSTPAEASTTLTVSNAPPTALLANNGPGLEGSARTVSFSNAMDPSAADQSAGFLYSFDFNNDGDFEDPGEIADSTNPIGVFTFDDNGVYTVRGRIKDKDGDFTDYLTAVVVNNVAPTATFSHGGDVNEGSSTSVTFAAMFDPSNADTQAGFRYAYDFNSDGVFEIGDGTYLNSSSSASVMVPASFLDDGPATRTVRALIIDKNNGSTEMFTNIAIMGVPPTAQLINDGPLSESKPITVTFGTVFDPSTADTLAGFLYSFDFNNDGDFTDPGDVLNSTSPSAQFHFSHEGVFEVRGRITDKDGTFSDIITNVTVLDADIIAIGFDAGGQSRVRVLNAADRTERFSFTAYPATFPGGVRVAVGDVTNDGVPDIITAPGPNGSAANGSLEIKVFNGVDGTPLTGFGRGVQPFGGGFNRGMYIAAGDFNGDFIADIVIGPGGGSAPIVRVIDGANPNVTLFDFMAYDNIKPFRKGVRVAVGDVTGDGVLDIITSSGVGTSLVARVFDGVTGKPVVGTFASFNPFYGLPQVKAAPNITAADLDGDGKAEIIASVSKGRPLVRVFNSATATVRQFTQPGALAPFKGGLTLGITDTNGDGLAEILVGTSRQKGRQPQVFVLNGQDLTLLDTVMADPQQAFQGGVFVAGGK
jgi:hypothetical protein